MVPADASSRKERRKSVGRVLRSETKTLVPRSLRQEQLVTIGIIYNIVVEEIEDLLLLLIYYNI